MPNPEVSIVVAVYNAQPYLAQAVDSLLSQTFSDFEAIFVDDGSTDGGGAYLDELAGRDPRVRVFHQANGGVARARNAGISHCRGKYMAVADADDICLPDRLAKQIAFLERRPDIAVLGGSLLIMSENGELTSKCHSFPTTPAQVRTRLLRHCCIPHPAAMVRMEAVKSVGGYRPIFRMCSDHDLWLRINDRHECANLPDPLVKYRYHAASITVNTLGVDALSFLAAAYSARFRRQHGHDPIDKASLLSLEVLRSVGVPQEMIDLNIAYAYICKAKRLANDDANDAAQRLLDLYRQLGGQPWIRHWLAPYELKVRARIGKNLGRTGESLRFSLQHCLLLPLSYCTWAAYGRRGIELW
jgi:glycosyltransferase involved in cell wall biosynthesis